MTGLLQESETTRQEKGVRILWNYEASMYAGDWKPYLLSHAPRQIAEETNPRFAKEFYHVYCFRNKDILKPFSIDPTDCLDCIPDDDYFENVFNQYYLGNTYDLTVTDVKLAFTAMAVCVCTAELNRKRELDFMCKKQYILTHTPREIAEEKGYQIVRQYYEVFCGSGEDAISPFPIDPADYLDKIPADAFFDEYYEEHYLDNYRYVTVEDVKCAFIVCGAMLCVEEPNDGSL